MHQYALEKGINIGYHDINLQSDIQVVFGILAVILLASSFQALIGSRGFGYIAFTPPLFCSIGMSGIFIMAAYNISYK
jgi:ATP/ADP translocase